jgi:hypothetical protein
MTEIRFSAERVVDAPADVVYHRIADYVRHHRHLPQGFLPPAFSDMEIEAGGVGAGTVIHFTTRAMGQSQRHHARVSEPQPGRVLQESEEHNNLSTTFTVEPQGSQQSRVRFDTRLLQVRLRRLARETPDRPHPRPHVRRRTANPRAARPRPRPAQLLPRRASTNSEF